jgi:hypothetical protein
VPGIEGLSDDAPVDLFRANLWKIQEDLNPIFGLLSFSSTPHEPSLWSHYAEKHTGIALVFDISQNHLVVEKVQYPDPPKRPAIHINNLYAVLSNDEELELWVRKTLTTKALQWKAESESRALVHFTLGDCRCKKGNYFIPIKDAGLVLVEVILGCKCKLNENYINKTLKQRGFNAVRVFRAKLSVDKFQVEY